MFRIEWTAHEPKPRAEVDELYEALLESVAIDGPHQFAVLVCAAQLLETRYAVARLVGYADREPTLDCRDIVEFFTSMDEALEALERRRTGMLEFYPASAAEYIVFDAAGERVRLFRVPWREVSGADVEGPLPRRITAHPEAACDRSALVGHLEDLRREFARAAIEHDPRLAGHEPLRRWSLGDSRGGRNA